MRYLQIIKNLIHLTYRIIFKPTNKGGWPFISLQNHINAVKIWTKFLTSPQQFGVNKLYQAFEPLHLPGMRPTEERITTYQLDTLLKNNSKVLDIGSNMGCVANILGLQGHQVLGVEYNEVLVDISNQIKKISSNDNVTFIHESFVDYETSKTFDCILALAVHRWVPMPFSDFLDKVYGLLDKGGILIFESNNYDKISKEFEAEVQQIIARGFQEINSGTSHYECLRKFYILKKI